MDYSDQFRNKSWPLITFLLLLGLTTGCSDASRRISSGVFETHFSSERVIQAAEQALMTIGYHVNETNDSHDGSRTVVGQRMGMVTWRGPALVHIQVNINPLPEGAQIKVDVIPPTWAYGTSALPFHDYQYVLSQLIPDLTAKSTRLPKSWLLDI